MEFLFDTAGMPEIIQVVSGVNDPQYSEAYKSCGPILSSTNGGFVRQVILEGGISARYSGDCSPSGSRYMEYLDKKYMFRFGQYWPTADGVEL